MLMFGLKAFNLYMLVERERWQGCPITRHGDFREDFAPYYRRLTDFLQRHRFWEYTREARVLVLLNYDLGRLRAATSTLNYAHADLLGLPNSLFSVEADLAALGLPADALAEADDERADTWLGCVCAVLRARSVDFDLADTHLVPDLARLARYDFVLVQDYANTDADDRVRINALQQPHQTVLWGQAAHAGVNALTPATYRCAQPNVDVTLHSNGTESLLFVCNFGEQATDADIAFEGVHRFTPVFYSCEAALATPTVVTANVRVALAPHSVRVFGVEAL
jgi:hypothetical protein